MALVGLLAGCAAAQPSPNRGGTGTNAVAGPAGSQTAGSVTPTTKPEPDVLADPEVAPGECKIVTYTPPEAKDAKVGELCRPHDRQRDVVVVVVHGGSGIGGGYANMRRWANRYLVEGYVTFLPSYHLFRVGGETPVFPHPEQNIKASVQFLRGTGNALGIRKDRIVVQGQSAGARIAAVAFTTPDDPWFAGPELYPGISDRVNGLIGFYHPYDATMQYANQYFGGPENSSDPLVRERLDKANSLAHAGDAPGPALFIVGSQDWGIIVQQQEAFAAILQQRSILATSIVIKGGGHGFDEGGARLSRLGEESAVRTLDWLNQSFPQNPPREASSTDADANNAPTYTGVPPTTYTPRPQPSGGYVTTTTFRSSGGAVTTTRPPVTVAPSSTAPSTTAPLPSSTVPTPSTSTPSTPSTTLSPPTTSAPVSTAPARVTTPTP